MAAEEAVAAERLKLAIMTKRLEALQVEMRLRLAEVAKAQCPVLESGDYAGGSAGGYKEGFSAEQLSTYGTDLGAADGPPALDGRAVQGDSIEATGSCREVAAPGREETGTGTLKRSAWRGLKNK
ncbi:hypothetical protein KFL_008770080 [Klebsormidium nitens]|uniref:Uncharacterized protein n=1 Tax=Klebsormidium nitens TaxID=105231 RepID=A0A1Y1ITC3_KLENI|nr:hypothetical protein KFL_008770080 [Klebsormidium nitens]|eukprot:GAQ91897.1 hypothetical protein KFL_008770080 [Klebsormidium nitens]